MMLNCSYTKPSGLGGWFIHSIMKFKMFSTPLTLTLGFIQAIKQKSGGIFFKYFKKIISLFSHISTKNGSSLYCLNIVLILQIHLSAIQDVDIYTTEHKLVEL